MSKQTTAPTALREVARAVKILAAVAFVAVLALAVVAQSTVPSWCDATPRDSATRCATESSAVK